MKSIIKSANARGIFMTMQKGRDLVARLLYAKSYSQMVAAERAYKLPPPTLHSPRTQELRNGRYGRHVDALAAIAKDQFAIPSSHDPLEKS